MSWLSPRVLFTLSMGAGATGLIVAPWLPVEPWRAGLSFIGALGLEKLVVSPVWGVFERFASRPARTLETAVFEEATAIANFDSDGCGVVSIDLDGHEIKILARLSPPDPRHRVLSGETLLVESVDAARNRCVVRRLTPHA